MSVASTHESFDHHRGKLPLLRRSRPVRTSLFVALNFAAYAVACAFVLYLSSGRWVDLSLSNYLRDFTTPLGEMFLFPVSLLANRWMILVTSVVLGLLIFLPVIMAVLYRLSYGIAFCMLVAVGAHAPVLAVCLVIGCLLAARTPLRSDMPFLAFLLGLLPQGLYLFLLSFAGVEVAADPFEHLLLKAPLLAAVVAAVLAGATTLWFARLNRYRPGVTWPLALTLTAVPMITFFSLGGPAELEFNLLTGSLRADDSLLEEMSVEDWQEQHQALGMNRDTLRGKVNDTLELRRRELTGQGEEFCARRRGTPQAAAMLWVKAQSSSLQVVCDSFDAGYVRYSASYPLEGSRRDWQRLVDEYPKEPQAALAQWRLAQLEMRDGKAADALKHLQTTQRRLVRLLSRDRRLQTPGKDYYRQALDNVERTIWLLEKSGVASAGTDEADARALAAFASLNPYEPGYAAQLEACAASAAGTRLDDPVQLAIARCCGDMTRRLAILSAIAEDDRSPWSPEACYELGQLTMKLDLAGPITVTTNSAPTTTTTSTTTTSTSTTTTAAATTTTVAVPLRKPAEYFRRVILRKPNPWVAPAHKKLELLEDRAGLGM